MILNRNTQLINFYLLQFLLMKQVGPKLGIPVLVSYLKSYKQYKMQDSYQKKIKYQNSDSEFVPGSDDQRNKILDPKWLTKKRKARLKIKDVTTKCSGAWNKRQNQIYMNFLREFKQDFQDQHLRRSRKVFNRISQLLPNRTPEQCRSHHQKLQTSIKSQNPDDIVKYLTARLVNNKCRASIKTTEEQKEKLKEDGYIVITGVIKQIQIILNQDFVMIW